jgi:hypothetical protein
VFGTQTTLDHIPGKIIMLTPNAEIEEGPRLVHVKRRRSDLDLKITSKTQKRYTYKLWIAKGLSPDDPPLDFAVETRFRHAVLMNTKEVEEAYASDTFKWDYFSHDADIPMDTLILEVKFPNSIRISLFATVFMNWSEFICHKEFARVSRGFRANSSSARFVINRPVNGFRYAIYWKFVDS